MVPIWPNKKIRDEFFEELRALLEKYPNISNHMIRMYDEDPTNACWSPSDGYPIFDPNSPIFLQGVVIVVSHSNMEHYEDLSILEPYDQSHFLSGGILNRASVIYGPDDVTD